MYLNSKGYGITVKDLQILGLNSVFPVHNLTEYDCSKFRNKFSRLKSCAPSFMAQQTRSEHLKQLKTLYSNYSIKQLTEIGFNI